MASISCAWVVDSWSSTEYPLRRILCWCEEQKEAQSREGDKVRSSSECHELQKGTYLAFKSSGLARHVEDAVARWLKLMGLWMPQLMNELKTCAQQSLKLLANQPIRRQMTDAGAAMLCPSSLSTPLGQRGLHQHDCSHIGHFSIPLWDALGALSHQVESGSA
jgi:hypothetical protein